MKHQINILLFICTKTFIQLRSLMLKLWVYEFCGMQWKYSYTMSMFCIQKPRKVNQQMAVGSYWMDSECDINLNSQNSQKTWEKCCGVTVDDLKPKWKCMCYRSGFQYFCAGSRCFITRGSECHQDHFKTDLLFLFFHEMQFRLQVSSSA